MILLPAIDLLDGQCVRLRRGDFDTAHRVAADPLETARSFEQAGAAWIHMVDLDGARTGSAQNQEIILRIARETSLLVEAGGGIRDMDTVAYYLQNGVSRVVVEWLMYRDSAALVKLRCSTTAMKIRSWSKRLWNNTAAALPLELMQKTAWSAPGAGCQIPRRIICPWPKKWIWLDLAGSFLPTSLKTV